MFQVSAHARADDSTCSQSLLLALVLVLLLELKYLPRAECNWDLQESTVSPSWRRCCEVRYYGRRRCEADPFRQQIFYGTR